MAPAASARASAVHVEKKIATTAAQTIRAIRLPFEPSPEIHPFFTLCSIEVAMLPPGCSRPHPIPDVREIIPGPIPARYQNARAESLARPAGFHGP
ncbi:MAG: hypothetical protein OEM49_12725 [Myxococcales bacterium]|nr:hypothetical protein [Myxococcales bacterium]MDH5567081.1 hypothetical protein [Myxococcales bacterium]